jgi:hypothetical protein
LQIKGPDKARAQRFSQLSKKKEEQTRKIMQCKSTKRGGKFIYGVPKGKEKLCEEDI